jgi:PIN domain nuclease of toxin-antitoxin system
LRALLDTHALLWWVTEDRRLGRKARDAISSSDVLVSVVSLWEIEIKRSLGRLDTDVQQVIDEVTRTRGFELIDVRPSHVLSLSQLQSGHGDPFDRMLVAQARQERAALVSKDRYLGEYDVEVYW